VISTHIEKGNEISRTHFSTVYTGSLGERKVAIKVLWQGNKDAKRLQKVSVLPPVLDERNSCTTGLPE
jgi:hypothetical protein